MSLENLGVIVEETVEVDDLMTLDQIKLAKKAIKIASPLIGGWEGDLMRQYLRWREGRENSMKDFKLIEATVDRIQEEVNNIKEVIYRKDFSLDDEGYKLKLSFRIIEQCVKLMEESVTDKKDFVQFYPSEETRRKVK